MTCGETTGKIMKPFRIRVKHEPINITIEYQYLDTLSRHFSYIHDDYNTTIVENTTTHGMQKGHST